MKNQIKLIAILLCLPLFLLGQNKFSLGFNVGTELSFMKMKNDNASVLTSDITESGKSALGYSLGVHISYYIGEQLFLRSGLGYEQSTFRHVVDGFRFGSDINGTTSYIKNDLSISSIGIPLDMIYKIPLKSGTSKILLGFGGLLNVNLDTKSSTKLIYGSGDSQPIEEPTNKIDPAAFSLLFYTGFEMGLEKGMRLSFEPHVKYTPNEFILHLYESRVSSVFDVGVTVRLTLN